MSNIASFIHNVFIGIIALFPVINPIGTAFVINPHFSGISRDDRRKMVRKIALYTFYLCVVTLFSGHWILQLFGLSVPVVRIAGGIVICKMGWDFLSAKEKSSNDNNIDPTKLNSKLFYPLTFPMTAGAGTLSVLFTLSAHSTGEGTRFVDYMLTTSAILVAVIVMCVFVYVMYLNSDLIVKRLGSKNEMIINRIVAFLIFCVGLEIALNGVQNFFK